VKKPFLITLFLLAGVGAYLLYDHVYNRKLIGAWDLVPEETVLVYESSACKECVDEIRASPVAELIRKASTYNSGSDSLQAIKDFLSSFQYPTLVSLQITKKDEFDFGYYITNSPAFAEKFSALLQSLQTLKGIKRTRRVFNDVIINEFQFNKNVFSWVEIDNVWAGSFSPVIVEDVIRTYEDKVYNFRSSISGVYQLPRVKNDGGNVYVQLSNFTRLLSLFTGQSVNPLLKNFGSAALLDSRMENGRMVLNGFSAQSENNMFLSAFSDQVPVPFSLRNLISNRAIMVSSYGVSDAERFFARAGNLSRKRNRDSLNLILKEAKVDAAPLLKQFTGEIAMCWLEGRSESFVPVLMIHDNNGIDKWADMFYRISESNVTDSVFIDRYSNYSIYELPVYRFAEKMFDPLVEGFTISYYVKTGNAICMSEDIEELKAFLQDIEQENTWGKSVAQNRFLESTLLEANVSVFINTPKVWSMLESHLHPKWKTFVKENQQSVRALGMAALQFSHLNDNFYTNVSWALQEVKTQAPAPKDRFMTVFDGNISSMYVVTSHVDKSKEVLIQDTLKNLSLISGDGKILWKLPLDGYIQGGVAQVDFLNNGKLQYFFCTPGRLHVVDRLGNYVKPYPVAIPEQNIEFASLVDYDHNKKYRFLVSSREGKLWIYDKEGNNLEGWQPKEVGGGLAVPAAHHRLAGKDYMVAIRRDGVVTLMNRKGETLSNFPLDLKVRVAGHYFVQSAKNAAETTITVVSTDGIKIRFNLQGKVLSREVLVKTALDAKFRLVAENQGKSYLIMRQEAKQLTLFDDKGKEVITSDFIGNNYADIAFTMFGNGRSYITITDRIQELSYIYDREGKLITSFPVEASQIEILPLDNDRLKVYSTVDNTFNINFVP
jgi:hypothetical protein